MINKTLAELKEEFRKLGFCALNFTDSRWVYQFMNLEHLNKVISECIKKGIRKINLVTEPVSVSEVYAYLTGEEFVNHLDRPLINYDLRTVYTESGYIMDKGQELAEIAEFVRSLGN